MISAKSETLHGGQPTGNQGIVRKVLKFCQKSRKIIYPLIDFGLSDDLHKSYWHDIDVCVIFKRQNQEK